MNKLYSIFLLSFSLFTYGQKTDFKIELLKGKQAFDHIFNSKQVRLKSYTDVPNYIEFIEGKEPLEADVFEILNSTSKNELSFEFINSINDELNMTHKRYKQTVNGYPVEHSMIIVHTKAGKVISVNGDALSFIPTEESSSISFDIALQIAKGHIGAVQYKWEDPSEEKFIKAEQKDPKATFYPKNELVYVTKDADFSKELRLAYKLNIYAKEPLSRQELFIDAINGEVLFKNNLLHHADVVGTASTAYSGSQSITADSFGGGFRLRESGRGNGIETYDLNRSNTTGGAVDFTDTDNNWSNVNALFDEYATDAHFGSEKTYDYYMQVHNRNSIDGQGFALKNYVHYGTNYTGAFWDGARMTYGDGDTIITTTNVVKTTPFTSMDVIAHEITHGLVSNTANLVYSSEPGGLDESFADIFGVSVDFWSRPIKANWLIGDEITIGNSYIRSLSDPKSKNNPNCYEGQYWTYFPGAVHTISGVQNFWYYLLVNGGSGTNDNNDTYTVNGLGIKKAEKIAFRNLTCYLTPYSEYIDARYYAIKSAKDLYGNCSTEVESTRNAWYAVGLGDAYSSNVTADFKINSLDTSCVAPYEVSFTNLSNNALTYFWDFGDGNTSTQINPNHTYTNYGTYTVKLIANLHSCGIDSIIKTSYIVIDSTLFCPTYTPYNGHLTITDCSGTLVDHGGPHGNYLGNSNSTVTIRPPGAGKIYLTINSFDVQGSDNSCWKHHLIIHGGPSTSFPRVGTYCNTNLPPTNIVIDNEAVTFDFYSNWSGSEAGYNISWSCSPPDTLPAANFSYLPNGTTGICQGDEVKFYLGGSGYTNFSWSFPGGSPSSSTNLQPRVNYNSPGIYPATLIVSNSLGNDTIEKLIDVSTCSYSFNNSFQRIFKCYGTLYDVGGENNNYTANQNTYVNINPDGSNTVTLDMEFFDIESGSFGTNCDYDYIEIYDGYTDGNNAFAPLIGKYCNSNMPPSTITSTAGQITILFHSDNSVNLQGVKINWMCNPITPNVIPPVIHFVGRGRSLCPGGVVSFADFSSNYPTSYNWSFPGGTPSTSNIREPFIQYKSPGLYKVELLVANSAGADSAIETDFIRVYDTVTNYDYTYVQSGLNVLFNNNTIYNNYWAWNFGDGSVSVDQNPNHTYALPGSYKVCLEVGNRHCGSKTICKTITIDPPLGLGDINLIRSFKLFPNPTNSLLNVHVEFFKEKELSIKLVDVVGNLLIKQSFNKKSNRHQEVINMSALSKGSYILYVNNVAHKVTKN